MRACVLRLLVYIIIQGWSDRQSAEVWSVQTCWMLLVSALLTSCTYLFIASLSSIFLVCKWRWISKFICMYTTMWNNLVCYVYKLTLNMCVFFIRAIFIGNLMAWSFDILQNSEFPWRFVKFVFSQTRFKVPWLSINMFFPVRGCPGIVITRFSCIYVYIVLHVTLSWNSDEYMMWYWIQTQMVIAMNFILL